MLDIYETSTILGRHHAAVTYAAATARRTMNVAKLSTGGEARPTAGYILINYLWRLRFIRRISPAVRKPDKSDVLSCRAVERQKLRHRRHLLTRMAWSPVPAIRQFSIIPFIRRKLCLIRHIIHESDLMYFDCWLSARWQLIPATQSHPPRCFARNITTEAVLTQAQMCVTALHV